MRQDQKGPVFLPPFRLIDTLVALEKGERVIELLEPVADHWRQNRVIGKSISRVTKKRLFGLKRGYLLAGQKQKARRLLQEMIQTDPKVCEEGTPGASENQGALGKIGDGARAGPLPRSRFPFADPPSVAADRRRIPRLSARRRAFGVVCVEMFGAAGLTKKSPDSMPALWRALMHLVAGATRPGGLFIYRAGTTIVACCRVRMAPRSKNCAPRFWRPARSWRSRGGPPRWGVGCASALRVATRTATTCWMRSCWWHKTALPWRRIAAVAAACTPTSTS